MGRALKIKGTFRQVKILSANKTRKEAIHKMTLVYGWYVSC